MYQPKHDSGWSLLGGIVGLLILFAVAVSLLKQIGHWVAGQGFLGLLVLVLVIVFGLLVMARRATR